MGPVGLLKNPSLVPLNPSFYVILRESFAFCHPEYFTPMDQVAISFFSLLTFEGILTTNGEFWLRGSCGNNRQGGSISCPSGKVNPYIYARHCRLQIVALRDAPMDIGAPQGIGLL